MCHKCIYIHLKLNEIQDEIMSRDSVTVNDVSNQKPHFCYIIQYNILKKRLPSVIPLNQKKY